MQKPEIKKADYLQVGIDVEERKKGLFVFRCCFTTDRKEAQEKGFTEFTWSFPYLDCAGVWHPNCGFDRSVDADWSCYFRSMTASSAPVMTLFSEDGYNRYTLAVSEAKEVIEIRPGIHEEDGTILLQVKVPDAYVAAAGNYELEVLIDQRDIPFYEAIAGISKWWEEECELTPVKTPDAAREPVYSTWYSYHQNLTYAQIEKECRLASEIGFKTVILDDGWQTDDNNRGYAFCGDWKVSENRFPDFKGHIQNVHDMGMKYMIWYSVPFLGCKSEKWDEFKDKLLFYADSMEAGVLDPRYPQVREYLVETYMTGLRQWNLDGFKLDFIDQMIAGNHTPVYNEAMDYESVQEALNCLMLKVYEAISKEKEDIMVEFRQSYIGPNMRRYGNMFRVTDCPNSAIRNRVGIVDLRMLSGQTAVHSDPLMWHLDEAPNLAAIQIISSIFSTVQISVKLEESTDEMRRMLRFWTSFMSEHKELLQKEQLRPQEPHNLYPVVWTWNKEEAVCAVYSENRIITLPEEVKDHIILNGTKKMRIILESGDSKAFDITVKDCMGEVMDTFIHEGAMELLEIKTPVAGQIYIRKMEQTR